jgi:uncharacterized protein YigE (DUF2233 family)
MAPQIHSRNGVGTIQRRHPAVFAISNEAVNFHDFGIAVS